MTLILTTFGLTVVFFGAVGVLNPRRLNEMFSAGEIRSRFRGAVLMRLLVAAIMIGSAPHCRFPSLVYALGIAAFLSASWLCVIGKKKFEWIVDWWSRRPVLTLRAVSVVAIDVGLFLFYAPR